MVAFYLCWPSYIIKLERASTTILMSQINQEEIASTFFAILLLAIFIGYLFSTDSNKLVKTRIIPVFLLVLISYFLNKKIKVSRHTPFSFSIAVMMIKVEVSTAFTMVLFAIINGYSRLYLKRHTMPDVAIRAFLGISIGFLFHVIYQFSL